MVYLGYASHGDHQPWHGWVLGYNASTLAQVMKWSVSPNGYGGGIWQSGEALATDASGNVFFTTGNGNFNANTGGSDYGDTVVKLSPAGTVTDYFTPFDQANMESSNFDLSSAGPVLLIDQTGNAALTVGSCGKNGNDLCGKSRQHGTLPLRQRYPDRAISGGNSSKWNARDR